VKKENREDREKVKGKNARKKLNERKKERETVCMKEREHGTRNLTTLINDGNVRNKIRNEF
jgi:hypothetical protein